MQATVHGRGGELQLETLVAGPSQTPGGRGGKRFRVNGIPKRGVDFVGSLRAVLFTADDLEIISGPPATRRGYLDAALSQANRAYHVSLQNYGRVMQQRNATLKRIKDGMAGVDELMLWDDTFANEAANIISMRQERCSAWARWRRNRIRSYRARARRWPSPTRRSLAMSFDPCCSRRLRRRRCGRCSPWRRPRRDAARWRPGLSLVGPHRDDVSIKLNGVAASSFGSRAQIRTAALSLRLAEARMLRMDGDDPPVLLLDDIVSELDERRRASVLEGVAGFEQVWFTATTGSWLPEGFVEGVAALHGYARGSDARVVGHPPHPTFSIFDGEGAQPQATTLPAHRRVWNRFGVVASLAWDVPL